MSGNSLLLQGQQSAKAASGGLETKAANGSDALTNNAQKTQNGPYDEDGDLSAHLVKWGGHIASKNRNPGNLHPFYYRNDKRRRGKLRGAGKGSRIVYS